MKISVVIPTYNRREPALRAVSSALTQTRPPDEVIVVDDGSTDGTADALAQRYAGQVTVLRQANAGVSAARNRGIAAARSEWIAFLDSDDEWLPEKIARQCAAIERAQAGCRVCFTNALLCEDEVTASAFARRGMAETGIGILEDTPACVLNGPPVIFIQCVLADRELLLSLGGFDERLTVSEDTDVLFRMAFQTCYCYAAEPLVRIDRGLKRGPALSDIYKRGGPSKYSSFRQLYEKWLADRGIASSAHAPDIRAKLRSVHIEQASAALARLRVSAAVAPLCAASALGGGWAGTIRDLTAKARGKLGSDPRRGKG